MASNASDSSSPDAFWRSTPKLFGVSFVDTVAVVLIAG
jgi:hypothetical protein